MRLRQVIWRARRSRSADFRRAVRALVLLLVSGTIGLGAPATPASTGAAEPDPTDEGETWGTARADG
ncbi:hypothetical protein [Actinomyces gaoshouyii]|nr:hypothetical protein [Actinomyces gaoshouyii]